MPDITNTPAKTVDNYTNNIANTNVENNIDDQKDISIESSTVEQASIVGSRLLGRYNVKNEYVIAPAIVEELYTASKLKKTTFRNSVFCTSYMPEYGELTFEVVYEKNSQNNTAKATMFLLEKEYKVNGYYQNTIKTKIGDYVADLNDFIQNSYVEFNINVAPVGSGKVYNVAEDNKLQGYLLAKNQFNTLIADFSSVECAHVYEAFFTQRLELLNKLGSEFSKEVLERFKKEYAKIEKYFLSSKDYKALSELLDKCLEDVSGINPKWAEQEKEYKQKMLPIILMFVDQMNTINANASKKARNAMKRKDRDKIDLIAEQEKTTIAPKSNAGTSRPHKIVAPVLKAVPPQKPKPDNIAERLEKLSNMNKVNKEPESTTNIKPEKSSVQERDNVKEKSINDYAVKRGDGEKTGFNVDDRVNDGVDHRDAGYIQQPSKETGLSKTVRRGPERGL